MATPQLIADSNTVFSTVPLEQPVSTGTAIASELIEAGIVDQSTEERPFFTDREKDVYQAVLFFPVTVIAWLITQPIRAFTWSVVKIKTIRYNPEKRVCPSCGFKGDSGTNGKTCTINFVSTAGPERAGIQHVCFRCGCDKHISPLFIHADKWLPREKVIVQKIEQG